MRTITYDSARHIAQLASRLAEDQDGATVSLRQLYDRRWRVLWTHDPTNEAATEAAAADSLPDGRALQLWASRGRELLAKVALEPSAAATVAGQASDDQDKDQDAPAASWTPTAAATDPADTANLFALWRSEVDRLRRELHDAQRLIFQLVQELRTAGKGSQGQLLNLIGSQTAMLTDAWRAAADRQAKERRQLDQLRQLAEDEASAAGEAVAAAEEAATEAEQSSAIVGALAEHFGPRILEAMKGGADG